MGDDAVSKAFRAVARPDFLRPEDHLMAGFDGPVAIGFGQTNSQPRTVHAMLDLLDVERGQKVLDLGSGSGWTTALLAYLVGSAGQVMGLELEPELVIFGRDNLARYDFPWAVIQPAKPHVLGSPADAPFDRILVSASAVLIPQPLIDQLAVGGVLVVPVGATMTRIEKQGPGADDVVATTHGLYSFVPLMWP